MEWFCRLEYKMYLVSILGVDFAKIDITTQFYPVYVPL